MLLELYKEAHTLVCNSILGLLKTRLNLVLFDTCQKVESVKFLKMLLQKCNTIELILFLRILL